MLIDVNPRPMTKTFFHYDGTNLDDLISHVTSVGFQVTRQVDGVVEIEGNGQTFTINPDDFVWAIKGQWGTQGEVCTRENMNQSYFPAAALPPVVE